MAMGVFILGLGTIFVFRSAHLVMRPCSDPPPEFVDTRPEVKPERLRAEERMARAYWECAAKTVQVRYPFGARLPSDPLPELKVDSRINPEIDHCKSQPGIAFIGETFAGCGACLRRENNTVQ
jgi:hypothetical protein